MMGLLQQSMNNLTEVPTILLRDQYCLIRESPSNPKANIIVLVRVHVKWLCLVLSLVARPTTDDTTILYRHMIALGQGGDTRWERESPLRKHHPPSSWRRGPS